MPASNAFFVSSGASCRVKGMSISFRSAYEKCVSPFATARLLGAAIGVHKLVIAQDGVGKERIGHFHLFHSRGQHSVTVNNYEVAAAPTPADSDADWPGGVDFRLNIIECEWSF